MAPDDNDDGSCRENDASKPLPDTEETLKPLLLRSCSSSRQRQMPCRASLHGPPPILPFELIVEILSRLPVKNLLRLRCVCKLWNSLISDPQFAKKHLRVSVMDTQFTHHKLILSFNKFNGQFMLGSYSVLSIFNNLPSSDALLKYPLEVQYRSHKIVGSCHGMLCFAIDQNLSLLWNPSIRKFKKLPSLEDKRSAGSSTIYGFGYDQLSDSYKVVAIFCYACDVKFGSTATDEVKVHTLGTDSWRRIQDFPGMPDVDFGYGKFVCGKLHWVASTFSTARSPCPWVIISLDLGNESYQQLWQPDYEEDVPAMNLEVLRDCLCILCHCESFLDVWLMKDYGVKESCTKLYTVPYWEIPDFYPCKKVLCISEKCEILLEDQSPTTSYIDYTESKLVMYDSSTGGLKHPNIQNLHGWVGAEVYVESLISPCS